VSFNCDHLRYKQEGAFDWAMEGKNVPFLGSFLEALTQ
jgi:hypothetical protein